MTQSNPLTAGESFGRFLVRRGVVTSEQLAEATESLVVVGGRIGTHLVELGHLDMEDLDRELAAHVGSPLPPGVWLENPDPEAIAALPPELLRRRMVLPLSIDRRVLHVAVVDPSDPQAVDEIAFAAGLAVRPYILAECHLAWLRERHLGVRRQARFADLEPETVRRMRRWRRGSAPVLSDDDDPTLRARRELGVEPLRVGEELLDEDTFRRMHGIWDDVPSEGVVELDREVPERRKRDRRVGRPAPVPSDASWLRKQLDAAEDREAITRCALRLARVVGRNAALFLVHRGVIRGITAEGDDMAQSVEGVLLPVGAHSVFSRVAETGLPHQGAVPRRGVDDQILRLLGRAGVGEVALLPIAIADRVVNLLYVDNGSEPLRPGSLAALSGVCESVAGAYERRIHQQRARHC